VWVIPKIMPQFIEEFPSLLSYKGWRQILGNNKVSIISIQGLSHKVTFIAANCTFGKLSLTIKLVVLNACHFGPECHDLGSELVIVL
jgi:hypothetical protein